jgi:hypothetical protein
VLVRRRPSGPGVLPSFALVLLAADGSARQAWVSGDVMISAAAAGGFLSVSAAADGWIVAAAEPPRLLRFDRAGRALSGEPFLSLAGRRVSADLLAEFERVAAAAGMSGRVRPPRYYPAVTAVRQVGDALLAVPYVGGSTGEAQGLDVYCGLRYTRTILDSPDMLQVLLAENAVIAVSQPAPTTFVVDMYRFSDLPLSCRDSA